MPVRELNPIDPRHIGHPIHDEQWLELARAIGRWEAREEYEAMQRRKGILNGSAKIGNRH